MAAIGTFDHVVVGAGTAGSALAARLSEDPARTTCLLEAGGADTHPLIKVPAAFFAVLSNPQLNWNFQTVPQPGMADRRIGVPRGKVLGGSGSINGMVFFRGQPADFDDWARAGATGWSYREVLPYFTRLEHNENFPSSVLHGRDGPLNIRTVAYPNPLNATFAAALSAMGFRHCPDFNGADPEGFGLRQVMVRDGTRESTARSMLRPAMRRRNLEVVTNAQVARLILDGRRATGVQLVDGRVVMARREVVLTAGAVQSPQLLMLSGIGPGAHLHDKGIAVAHDLPGVGRNLHDHVACPVQVESPVPVSFGLSWRALPRNVGSLLRYLATRRGPLSSNGFESVAFLRSEAAALRPDIQLVFQVAKRPSHRIYLPIGHGFAISAVSLYPQSRGTLTLASADPLAAPLIDPQLLSMSRDIVPLARALKLARSVLASDAFKNYRGVEVAPGPEIRTDEEIERYIRANAYTIHHPCSTCRMGQDDMAVVDPQLRVRGLNGLRVADASVFPSIIGGNTNAAVIMIAEKAADLILGRAAPPPAELPQ